MSQGAAEKVLMHSRAWQELLWIRNHPGNFDVPRQAPKRRNSTLRICLVVTPQVVRYSCRTTAKREALICRPPLYLMKPSFLNLFMKKLTRERVVPTISVSISCRILGSTPRGWSSSE